MAKSSGGLSRWFKEEWVDLSRPKKGGGFEPCGRPDADEGKYPKCVPKAKAMKMTQAEIDSAVRRKRRAESTEERKGKKPINVPTEVEKKSKNIPTNPKLYAKVKAEAKRKFDVYPSAYANGWLVQEYKRRGGGYKTVTKQQPDSSEVHVPSTNWKAKRKKKRGLSSLVDKHAEHDQKSHGSWANGQGAPSIRRTSYLPPELADRYVQLSREELEYLRSLGDFQQTLFGPEQKVGGLDERLLGFGYRSKAGFVIDVDDSWKTGLDEFGVKFEEDRWGDTQLDFSEATPEQIRALVSAVFDTDILSPDGKTLYQVRTQTADENYGGSIAAGCRVYQVDVATGERKQLRATIDRTLDFENSEVSNNVFRLPPEAQGKGIGTTLLAHWEDQQLALGLMYASVHASSGQGMNGGYTWLRTGYQPNDPRSVASTVGGDFWVDHIMYDMGLSDEIRRSVRDDYMAIIQSSIESELPDLSPRGAREFAEQLADQAVDAIHQQTTDNIYSAYASARDSTDDADDCLTVGRRIQDELYYANEAFISSYDNTGGYTDDEGVDHYFPGDSVTVDVNIYGYASSLQDEWTQVLKDSADWYGSKELESLGPAKRNDAILMRRDAIDADGDGIIFEGTEFERRIGTPKPVEKAMSGPSKPKSLSELFRWWADNDPAAWENDTPEVQASYQRFLSPKEPKLKKHAEHDQKSHGSWAASNQRKFKGKVVSNPKPFAGAGKKVEEGHEARPLPEVGDRIGIHLDLGGRESGLPGGDAFSIKTINRNGNPRYGTTQAHTLGVRLSDVGTHVSRSGLNGAIKRSSKNPHAAFTGKVEEWVNSREIPKGAVEISYHIDISKNPDGSPTQTADTTGIWYVKDGTYREFIGASDGIGIGGDLIEGGDKARTYVYGDVELGEVNPHVKEYFEKRKLTKAHRLIHESRTRQRPFELAKHGDHDQLTHGNWAKGRVSSGKGIPVPEGYVVLSLAERNYLARLPELRQGTLMRPLFMRNEPTSSQETPRLGEKLVSVDPSDFATVYETRAGMVIDSAEPEYFDEYVDADKMATDIFNLGLVTNDGRTLAVEARGVDRGNGVTGVSLTITDIETGEHLGMADRVLNDDPWAGSFVENNLFKLNDRIQGMGIGTTLLSHWEDQIARAGIGNMLVHAVSGHDMNGGYTWLRYGYTPNDPFMVVRQAPLDAVFFFDDWNRTEAFERILRDNNAAITNKALDMANDNNPGMNVRVDFDAYDLGVQVDDAITRRMEDLYREMRSSQQAGSTLFTTAEDVLAAPGLLRNEYESIFTKEIPVDVSITVRPSDQPFDDRSLDEARTVTIGVSPALFMNDAESQEERYYDYLKSSADWYGEKSTNELSYVLQPTQRAVVVRADAIDRDGDGIIFEGTPFERRIGTASRRVAKGKGKKKLRGPAKPSSLSELARWWADNDPAAWEQDTAEVRASYRRYLFSKARVDSKRKLKKHGTHDQKSHGNWARNLRIFRHIMENEGATFDIRTREFKKDGFAVADPAQAYQAEEKHSSPVFAEEGRKLIGEFIKNWEGELTEPNKYVGAWLDDGNYYLDVATVVMDRSKAIEMGKETDQIAIWDLGANAEVRLRKAGSRVLLVPGDALNEETIELLFNELMRLNDE